MNALIRNFALAALLIFAHSGHSEPTPLDQVVAVVDRDAIMQSQLEERLQQVSQRAQANNTALPSRAVLEQQVLDLLITEQLQLQLARRLGHTISDGEVNQTIERIRESNNLTPEQFQQALMQENRTITDLREDVRRDLTIQQIQQGVVQQRIHISPLEIDNFLQSADARFWVSPDYHLGHILVGLPQSPTPEDIAAAQQKAEDIVARVRQGVDFAEIAIAESRSPDALEGGDMGWRKTSELPSLFAEVAPRLEVGETSDPFRSGAGFHILKLHDKRDDTAQLETQTQARHILLKPSAILSDEEAEEKLKELRQQILDGADFGDLARLHSEDIGSMLAGGDLGWSRPGMFVPAFEETIEKTAEGEISQPFRSRFGWHILQVVERRQEDISQEVLRNRAAQALTSRRFEDELEVWLRELRDDAYVDVRL